MFMWKNLINLFKRDNLYMQALEESYTMLDLDFQMFEASVQSLRKTDNSDIGIDIYAMDKEINRFERDVRKKVMTHLAISGPANLTSGLVLVSVVIDIERIGDYAKNIYDLARMHPARLNGKNLESDLQIIETGVTKLFKETVEAFKTSDVEMSRQIMNNYKTSLAMACEGIITRIVKGEITDLSSSDAAAIVLYARYLKRIAGHSRNIITGVVNPFHRIGYKEKKNA
ncbi:MAG: PhoU domain-containing protein [Opitutales bacterium]